MRPLYISVSVVTLLVGITVAQNANVTASDPRALALIVRSVSAMTGGANMTDATLDVTVTSFSGSNSVKSDSAFVSKGGDKSRIDLATSEGHRTEIRNDSGQFPQGAFTDSKGQITSSALHNCWVDPSWFFPALSYLSQTADPTLVFTYIGPETRNGVSVDHLRVARYLGSQSAKARNIIQKLSTMDIFLSLTSSLPVAFTFSGHPESDANTDIAVDIEFANYQSISGVVIPSHVQKIVQGRLDLDIVLDKAVFNSNPPDSMFAVE